MPVRGRVSTLTLSLPAEPRAISWNDGGWVLEAHDFPRPTVMLRYQLEHDDDATGRLEAVELLSKRVSEPMAVEAIAAAVRDDAFWAVREAAAAALRQFAAGDTATRDATPDSAPVATPAAATAATALIAAAADGDARVRQSAATSLAAFPRPDVEARLDELARSDSSLFVRGAALASLAHVAPDAALSEIRATLQRDSWLDIERTSAVRALEFVDAPEAWDMLLPWHALQVDRRTRQAAIAAITNRAMESGRQADASAAIVPVLNAPDFYSRADAAAALGTLGQESSIPALEARREVEAESRVINAIDAAAKEIRKQ
jgi:hypothetical protein